MVELRNKIKSYVGFAIKAAKVVYGLDNILKQRLNIKLIIFDDTLGESSKKKLMKFIGINGIKYFQTDMSNVVDKQNCKVIAIKDINLAQAIMNVIKERS